MQGAQGAGVNFPQGVHETGVQAWGLGADVAQLADLRQDAQDLLLGLSVGGQLGVGVVKQQVGAAERACECRRMY